MVNWVRIIMELSSPEKNMIIKIIKDKKDNIKNGNARMENHSIGLDANETSVLIVNKSNKTLYILDSPYLETPNFLAWCFTLISATLEPANDVIAGIKRCISEYNGTFFIISAL